MNEEFLFCAKVTYKTQTSLIAGRSTKVEVLHGPYHLFHQDQFGPTNSLCGKGRADIAESTKIMKFMPRGLDICPECKDTYIRTPLYQKWVKNAIPEQKPKRAKQTGKAN